MKCKTILISGISIVALLFLWACAIRKEQYNTPYVSFEAIGDACIVLINEDKNIGLYIKPQRILGDDEKYLEERVVKNLEEQVILCEFEENPIKTKNTTIKRHILTDLSQLYMLKDGSCYGYGSLKVAESVELWEGVYFIIDKKGMLSKFTFKKEPSAEITKFEKECAEIIGITVDASYIAREGYDRVIMNDPARLFLFSSGSRDWAFFFNTVKPLALFHEDITYTGASSIDNVHLCEMEWNGPAEFAGRIAYGSKELHLYSVDQANTQLIDV